MLSHVLSNEGKKIVFAGMYQWPFRDESSENNYDMEFKVKKIETLKRRNKLILPCYEFNDYDDFVLKTIMKRIGCQLPFISNSLNEDLFLPNCSSQEEINNISYATTEYYYGSIQDILPCHEVQQIQLDFNDVDYSKLSNLGESKNGSGVNWFVVRVEYQSFTFKQIKCVQKYCIQSLVGNAGGYVGLFVGYTLRQLPFVVISILSQLRKMKLFH